MLAYLEELCAALLAHDAGAIHRLLAHPLARSLPRQVREEAIAISRAQPTSLRAPIQTLRFYHQTLQLRASEPQGPGGDPSGGEAGGATEPNESSSPPDPPRDPSDPGSRASRRRGAPLATGDVERGDARDPDDQHQEAPATDGRDHQMELPFDLMAPAA
jgi:hypothetical protein